MMHLLFDEDDALEALPVLLTVYGATGTVTVRVREDSIQMKDGDLIAEGVDADFNRLFTFPTPVGYSTHH
jgi:hypothetical protein